MQITINEMTEEDVNLSSSYLQEEDVDILYQVQAVEGILYDPRLLILASLQIPEKVIIDYRTQAETIGLLPNHARYFASTFPNCTFSIITNQIVPSIQMEAQLLIVHSLSLPLTIEIVDYPECILPPSNIFRSKAHSQQVNVSNESCQGCLRYTYCNKGGDHFIVQGKPYKKEWHNIEDIPHCNITDLFTTLDALDINPIILSYVDRLHLFVPEVIPANLLQKIEDVQRVTTDLFLTVDGIHYQHTASTHAYRVLIIDSMYKEAIANILQENESTPIVLLVNYEELYDTLSVKDLDQLNYFIQRLQHSSTVTIWDQTHIIGSLQSNGDVCLSYFPHTPVVNLHEFDDNILKQALSEITPQKTFVDHSARLKYGGSYTLPFSIEFAISRALHI